ncbi:MAG: hypothetical protein WBM53_04565 [Maribacter sp.]
MSKLRFGPICNPSEKGICKMNPLSSNLVNGVNVSKEPIEAPIPDSR